MGNEKPEIERNFKKSLLLPTLLLGWFVVFVDTAFTSTLYVDIAASFKVSIGTATTLSVIFDSLGLIMGLAISFISLKFKHKNLLIFGIVSYMVGDLVFFFSQNFPTAMLSSFFSGMGAPLITIMSVTLIGELYPLEKRGWRVGLTVSATFAAYAIVGPLSGYVQGIAGWRAFLLWFSLPLDLACLALSLLAIPSLQPHIHLETQSLLKEAYKRVFLNKSAIACMVSTTLISFLSIVTVWNISFVRITFAVSPLMGGVFRAACATGAVIAGAVGGRLLNNVGGKPIASLGIFAAAVAILTFTFVPNVTLAVVELVLMASMTAFGLVGLRSLSLEQVPSFRSSMMSVSGTFQNVGLLVGTMMGTIVLTAYRNNFHILYLILGALGAVATPILLLVARDPTRTNFKEPVTRPES